MIVSSENLCFTNSWATTQETRVSPTSTTVPRVMEVPTTSHSGTESAGHLGPGNVSFNVVYVVVLERKGRCQGAGSRGDGILRFTFLNVEVSCLISFFFGSTGAIETRIRHASTTIGLRDMINSTHL